MKQLVTGVLLIAMISFLVPGEAKAYEGDSDVQEVLRDSFYGGLTGALVGGAFLAFRDKPSDHLEDIRIGAGIGVIIGAIYGLAQTTRAFANVENGAVTFHMPSLQFDVDRDTHALQGSVDFLKVPF